MKKILSVLTALVIGFVVTTTSASAREGSISVSNSDVACEGVSLWRESSYKVTGRCQGLVYPYETLYDHYVLWGRLENGNAVRIDDIDRGYFEGSVSTSFSQVFITAEGTSSPRRPGTRQVVAGTIEPFSFDTSKTTTPEPTPTPAAKSTTMTVQNGATAQSGSTVGSVIGKILKSLLVIVGVIIIVAVVASLLFRRRGSVSA